MNIWHDFTGAFKTGLQSLANFYSFLGGHRWAAAIITLTLIVRTLLLPLAMKQIRSMREQQRLQPEIARLRQKFKNDRQKMSQELMALYQREGVNPYAACLPMVVQMPVLFAMYGALRSLLALPPSLAAQVDAHKLDPAKAFALAQAHGQIPKMPFLGLGDLTKHVGQTPAGIILIVIMTAASFLSTRQLNVGQTDSQKRMQMLMPLMFVFIFIRYPAAMMLYWTTQTVYQYVQQLVMMRNQREKGWRGILGLSAKDGGKDGGRPNAKKVKDGTKPQVRASVPAPQPAAAVAVADGPQARFDPLATRRDLEEKRQRRRRNKKKRRKRS